MASSFFGRRLRLRRYPSIPRNFHALCHCQALMPWEDVVFQDGLFPPGVKSRARRRKVFKRRRKSFPSASWNSFLVVSAVQEAEKAVRHHDERMVVHRMLLVNEGGDLVFQKSARKYPYMKSIKVSLEGLQGCPSAESPLSKMTVKMARGNRIHFFFFPCGARRTWSPSSRARFSQPRKRAGKSASGKEKVHPSKKGEGEWKRTFSVSVVKSEWRSRRDRSSLQLLTRTTEGRILTCSFRPVHLQRHRDLFCRMDKGGGNEMIFCGAMPLKPSESRCVNGGSYSGLGDFVRQKVRKGCLHN